MHAAAAAAAAAVCLPAPAAVLAALSAAIAAAGVVAGAGAPRLTLLRVFAAAARPRGDTSAAQSCVTGERALIIIDQLFDYRNEI